MILVSGNRGRNVIAIFMLLTMLNMKHFLYNLYFIDVDLLTK